ncbi:hypothetical protein [Pandoraea apista]|uniref:hypothetical protein n=1 Tax=Pandoraea apista TaxID=93218 RepID=UPI00065967AD|nr:hypothetical protein [Pandoraea apista]ALS63612.1 hypothetical protein AT395_00130 [Pandoraea apista]CFB63140.1 hypothetical protein LMG16407_03215 [Pandoraea apista]
MEDVNEQQSGAEVAQVGEPVAATEQASSETSTTASSGADATLADVGLGTQSNESTGELQTGTSEGSTKGGDAPDSRAIARGAVSVGDIFSVVVRETHVTVVGRDGYVIIRDNEGTANDAA